MDTLNRWRGYKKPELPGNTRPTRDLPAPANMSIQQLRPFPTHFRLKDLTNITAPVFDFKLNPHQETAALAANAWFKQ